VKICTRSRSALGLALRRLSESSVMVGQGQSAPSEAQGAGGLLRTWSRMVHPCQYFFGSGWSDTSPTCPCKRAVHFWASLDCWPCWAGGFPWRAVSCL